LTECRSPRTTKAPDSDAFRPFHPRRHPPAAHTILLVVSTRAAALETRSRRGSVLEQVSESIENDARGSEGYKRDRRTVRDRSFRAAGSNPSKR
jgi:hypothetical protein